MASASAGTWVLAVEAMSQDEAMTARSLLESEGIEVFLQNEVGAQMLSFSAAGTPAIGLMVKAEDYERAKELLVGEPSEPRAPEAKDFGYYWRFAKRSAVIGLIALPVLPWSLYLYLRAWGLRPSAPSTEKSVTFWLLGAFHLLWMSGAAALLTRSQ